MVLEWLRTGEFPLTALRRRKRKAETPLQIEGQELDLSAGRPEQESRSDASDARRILAYSVVNQVGFMVVAVGIGTEMALNGAAAHAFAHIIYKALLFMSAGVQVDPHRNEGEPKT